jgi:hypothetical protein
MGLRHFAYPHCGAWAVVYVVPGTEVLSVVCTCRSLSAAQGEAQRLNSAAA